MFLFQLQSSGENTINGELPKRCRKPTWNRGKAYAELDDWRRIFTLTPPESLRDLGQVTAFLSHASFTLR